MRKTFGFILVVGLFATLTIGSLQAQKVIEVRETLSGTTQPSQINPSGEPDRTSGFGICEGSGNNYAPRGFKDFPASETNQFTCRTISQTGDPVGMDTPNCPGGMEIAVTAFSHVQRYNDREGSLLFSKIDPEGLNFLCFTPGSDIIRVVFTSTYDGGTGRFEGASGTAFWEFDNRALLIDPVTGDTLQMGSWGKTEGTLLLP